MTRPINCIVVDDSALSRKIVRTALESIPGVEVIAVARDGLDGLERCKELKPDLVTMDLEMPRMDGIEALRQLRTICPDAAVVMVSSLTSAGAESTNQALRAGAFDFVLKPVGRDLDDSIRILAEQLTEKVEALKMRPCPVGASPATCICAASTPSAPKLHLTQPAATERLVSEVRAICIGVSTGGPVALQTVIPALPADLPVPVFIVQHMPPVFTNSLAEQLDRLSQLRVVEAADGMHATPGVAYIAPGGFQMKLEPNLTNVTIRINQDAPVNNARPSVDYLFQSAVQCYGGKLAVAVLTGMGNDGLGGCERAKRAGGHVITQDAETSVVYGMPRCVNEAGLSEAILPLGQIADKLIQLAGQGAKLCR